MMRYASVALLLLMAVFLTKGETEQDLLSIITQLQMQQFLHDQLFPASTSNDNQGYQAPSGQYNQDTQQVQNGDGTYQQPYGAQPQNHQQQTPTFGNNPQNFQPNFNANLPPYNPQPPPPPQAGTGVSPNFEPTTACSSYITGRVICGRAGISQLDCEQLGCCFDTSYPDLTACFYRPDMANANTQYQYTPTRAPFYPASQGGTVATLPPYNPNVGETPPLPPFSQANSQPLPPVNHNVVSPLSRNPAPTLPPFQPSTHNSRPPPPQDNFPDFTPTSQYPAQPPQPDNGPPPTLFAPAAQGGSQQPQVQPAPAPQGNAQPQPSSVQAGSNRVPPQSQPVSTPSTIAFNGCLLHCSSLEPVTRRTCVPEVEKETCTRVGCCFDKVTGQCFHSNIIKDACPARHECKLPLGPVQTCGIPEISAEVCDLIGCCFNKISGKPTCYKKQANDVPSTPPTTLPTTVVTSTSEPTTKFDLLSKLKELQDQIDRQKTTVPPTSKTTTTTKTPELKQINVLPKAAGVTTNLEPAQPPVSRPPYVPRQPPPPQYRQECNSFGSCRYVLVPPRTCFPQKCGRPVYTPNSIKHNFDPRKIVGGSRAFPFSHPWMVMIQKNEGNRTYICGATLICKQWLVTAAHCLDKQSSRSNIPDYNPFMYKIFVGRWTGWQSQPGEHVQFFTGNDIQTMFQHENFIPGKHRGVITHDIALIKLRKPVRLDDYVQPACLPKAPPTPGEVMFATGWGISKNQGPRPTTLKQVGVQIKSFQVCKNRVPGFKNPVGVVCAGGEPNHDTCTGDSGGPLVGAQPGQKIRLGSAAKPVWHLYGLTSIGSPSCNTKHFDRQPALYTDIFYFLPWIKDKTFNCCG